MTRFPLLRKTFTGSGGILSTGASLAAAQVALAIAGIIAARALGPSGRGVATAVTTWALVLSTISLAGFNTAASVRVAGGTPEDLRRALGNAVGYAAVGGAIVTIAAIWTIPQVVDQLGSNAASIAFWAMLAIPVTILVEILLSVQLALGRRTIYMVARGLNGVIVLVATIALAIAGLLTPASVVAVALSGGALTIGITARGLPWRGIHFDGAAMWADLRFGVRIAAAGWMGMVNGRLDYMLMSAFLPAAQIGYYGVANNIMMPVITVASASAALITPAVAKLGADAGDKQRARRKQLQLIRSEAHRVVLLGACGAALLAVAAPVLVPFLLGHAFQPAVVLIWILLLGYVARAYTAVVAAGAAGLRVARIAGAAQAAALVVTVAMLPFLLPRFEAVGAAITSTCAYLVTAVVAYYMYRRLERADAEDPPPTAVPEPPPVLTAQSVDV